MRHILTALFIATLSTSVAAQSFYVGTWIYDGGDCAAPRYEGGNLQLSETELWGTENHCLMTNPIHIRDIDGILFDMECNGEGEIYTERQLFLNEQDGSLTTHSRGYTNNYQLCEEI